MCVCVPVDFCISDDPEKQSEMENKDKIGTFCGGKMSKALVNCFVLFKKKSQAFVHNSFNTVSGKKINKTSKTVTGDSVLFFLGFLLNI